MSDEMRWVRTRGMSMFATLLPGDEVSVESGVALSTGDLIAYIDATGELIVHRVLGLCPVTDSYITAGDGHRGADRPVPQSAIVGRVSGVRRRVLGVTTVLPGALWRRRWVPRPLVGALRKIALCLPRSLRKAIVG